MHGHKRLYTAVGSAIHKVVCNGSSAIAAWDELSKNEVQSMPASI